MVSIEKCFLLLLGQSVVVGRTKSRVDVCGRSSVHALESYTLELEDHFLPVSDLHDASSSHRVDQAPMYSGGATAQADHLVRGPRQKQGRWVQGREVLRDR